MKLHGNAALSLNKRKLLVHRVMEEDWSLREAARAAEVSERTAPKWVRRFRREGEAGLLDRPSAPRRVHNRTPEDRVQVIAALRRLRFTGPEIAEVLEMATSTISAVLKRIGLGKFSRLEPPEPPTATSAAGPASSCTSTSKSSGAWSAAGHLVTGRRRGNPTPSPIDPDPQSTICASRPSDCLIPSRRWAGPSCPAYRCRSAQLLPEEHSPPCQHIAWRC